MNFRQIFDSFAEQKSQLKVVTVASCDRNGKPNSSPKMMVDIVQPNRVYFLDYNHTRSFANISENPQLSISFMNDADFTGYRLNGMGKILTSGKEYEEAKKAWDKRVIAYETERILQRLRGQYSTKESESSLPKDFVIIRMTSHEGSIVKPDRIVRASADEEN